MKYAAAAQVATTEKSPPMISPGTPSHTIIGNPTNTEAMTATTCV